MTDSIDFAWMWNLISPTDVEPIIIMNIIDIRRSFKRTANSLGLNEDREGVQGLEKTRCEG